MKILLLGLISLFALPALAADHQEFNAYFNDHTMRVDYFHQGNSTDDQITLDHIYVYGQWAGNPNHLLDPFNSGRYQAQVLDATSGRLIYSKGYDSYFAEYRTTAPAIKGIKRSYHESILLPEPKNKIRLQIQERQRDQQLKVVFEQEIDPQDVHIIREAPQLDEKIVKSLHSGDPQEKVDVVFLAEGYTKDEFELFEQDVKERTDLLFTIEPYKSNKTRFNISGVFRPSAQSGVDEPDKGIYKRTALNSTFFSLDLNRYLLTEDNKTLRDMAGVVPYDAIFIMVNSQRYGGGGIYNQYAVFTAHSPATELVFVHEFGHSFAGLADEYYASAVAYNDFYPQGIEPSEPNITALLDPEKPKWENQVDPGLAIPTEWGKAYYDSLSFKRQALRQKLYKNLEPKEKEAIQNQMKELAGLQKDFFANHPLKNKTGFFEGAGYSAHGLYRPMLNCMMFSNQEKKFCTVCQAAIQRMIDFYSK